LGILTIARSGKGNLSSNYTNRFDGTSAATPGVAGVVALMLQANPNLTWRQARWILAETARKVDASNSLSWEKSALTGSNVNGYSHEYGYGVPDATVAVAMAKNNPPQLGSYQSCAVTAASGVPTSLSTTPTNISIDVSSCTNLSTIEFVEIKVNFAHSFFGDLNFSLVSPNGSPNYESVLAANHQCGDFQNNVTPNPAVCDYSQGRTFTFGSVRHMNENPRGGNGIWTFKAYETMGGNSVHSLNGVTLVFWGY
jgi:kexin